LSQTEQADRWIRNHTDCSWIDDGFYHTDCSRIESWSYSVAGLSCNE
jgi:hypothetical protein